MVSKFQDLLANYFGSLSIQVLLLTSVLALVLYYISIKYLRVKSSHYPPGPRGLPIIGFLPSLLDNKPHEVMHTLAMKYGEIFSITIAGSPYVVLSSYKAIRAAYITAAANFSDRPCAFNMLSQFFNYKAMAFISGIEWKAQRKILSSWLKAGNSQAIMEKTVSETTEALIEKIHALNSQPVDIYNLFANSAMDLVSSLVCGERLATVEPETAKSILADSRSLFQLASGGEAVLVGWLLNLICHPFTKKRMEIRRLQKRQFELMARFIKDHQSTFDASNARDYIDAFLAEREISGPLTKPWFDLKTLASNMIMIYTAGTDTSSSALYFSTYLMAKYPEIQIRCQKELDSEIGSRVIDFCDRKRLPYIEAALNEVLRYAAIGALPQPRCSHERATLLNFDIPANTNIITNLWTATRDPEYFSNPKEFDPDNFYEKNIPRDISSLPFSAGKRICPGEGLARLEFFMVFTSLLQQFVITFPPECAEDYVTEKLLPGFTRVLAPFQIIATPR